MKKYEKFRGLCDQIDNLIDNKVTSSSPQLIAWKNATERFLINEFGENSYEHTDFKKKHFSPLSFNVTQAESINSCRNTLEIVKAIFETYLSEMEEETVNQEESFKTTEVADNQTSNADFSKVFIVHGHDGALKHEVARLIEKQGIEAIILSEQANEGATVIEKIERYSDVDAAICLFTPDDHGKEKNDEELNFRARQNVVFETGYFMAKLRRENVILISEKNVELPSDLQGVMYTNTTEWKPKVLLELKKIGYSIDFNKLYE